MPARGRVGFRFAAAFAAVLAATGAQSSASAQPSLGFEREPAGAAPAGWTLLQRTRGTAVVDGAAAAEGRQSLRVEGAAGGLRIVRRLAVADLRAAHGAAVNRARLRAQVRGEDASIWLRIDGPLGPLFTDSRMDGAAHGLSTDRSPAEWRLHEVEIPLPEDAEELAIGAVSRGAAPAWFDDFQLDALDTGTLPELSRGAARYVADAVGLMERHALRRDEVDWATVRAAALLQARGAAQTAGAYHGLRLALRAIGDRHSYLLTPPAMAALIEAPVANARTGRGVDEPRLQLLPGRVAQLAVPGFAGGTPLQQVAFANRLQELIETASISDACRYILDLRENSGGNLWPMLAGLGPLLGDGELGASVYPGGRRTPFWYSEGKAGFGEYVQLRVSRPAVQLPEDVAVAVLIGRRTASSAEVLVAALQGRGGVRSFGAPTRGLSAGNRTFELPDGAALVLTVAGTSDRKGRIYTGPIAPDVAVDEGLEMPSGPPHEADAARSAAVDWLRALPPCA